MTKLNPKIEIINYFDELINRVDIDIEYSIKKSKTNQVLRDFKYFSIRNRKFWEHGKYLLKYVHSSNESSKKEAAIEEWSESTKIIDYLNQVRQRTIDELRKAQEESLEYYKSNSRDLNQLISDPYDLEEMKRRLFANKFYFQVHAKPSEYKFPWVFNLYTIECDFYLSWSDIDLIKYFINYGVDKEERFYSDETINFDEKCVLIHSLSKKFCENLSTKRYPSHKISFRKRDLLNIKAIQLNLTNLIQISFNCSSSYFSNLEELEINPNTYGNLEEVRIEGIPSLKSLYFQIASESLEGFSICNMSSLRILKLRIKCEINNSLLAKLFESCPNIEELTLGDRFSNLNVDSFVSLKKLILFGSLLDEFNFDIFKNICNQLEELSIEFVNMNDDQISKLLYGHIFPKLSILEIRSRKKIRLEKKLFDGFPKLQSLSVNYNMEHKTIDKDAFSNLENLKELDLSFNHLTEVDAEIFSCLKNLEKLNLSFNKLKHFDLKILDYLVNIKNIDLSRNPIENKKEIQHRFKQMKIEFNIELDY